MSLDPNSGCYGAEVKKPDGDVPTVLVSAVALIDTDGRVLLAKTNLATRGLQYGRNVEIGKTFF